MKTYTEEQMKLASKHTPGPWYAVEYAGYWNINDEPYYEAKNILNSEDVGPDKAEANAVMASTAPEAIEFIADLLNEMSTPGTINGAYWVNRGEEILKKAYNL